MFPRKPRAQIGLSHTQGIAGRPTSTGVSIRRQTKEGGIVFAKEAVL